MTWKLWCSVGFRIIFRGEQQFHNLPTQYGYGDAEEEECIAGKLMERDSERESDTVWDWEWLEKPREGRDRATQQGER